VNQKIRENIALEEARNLPIEEAKKAGAMMLFGEKYGETVRMITFDPAYSRELCGGCHVKYTGQIGYFKITAETAVAAGVRRVEAVTAKGAEQYVSGLENEIASIKNVLKAKDLTKGIVALQEENKQLQKAIERMVQEQANGLREGLRSKFEAIEWHSALGRNPTHRRCQCSQKPGGGTRTRNGQRRHCIRLGFQRRKAIAYHQNQR
jgi:alanyl-tRNA synthetase